MIDLQNGPFQAEMQRQRPVTAKFRLELPDTLPGLLRGNVHAKSQRPVSVILAEIGSVGGFGGSTGRAGTAAAVSGPGSVIGFNVGFPSPAEAMIAAIEGLATILAQWSVSCL
jgi:hypothetical protein